jgi:hypothetical protein
LGLVGHKAAAASWDAQVVLEGRDGVADMGKEKQAAFEAWITRVAREVHQGDQQAVTVELEYMQELRGVLDGHSGQSQGPELTRRSQPSPSPSTLQPESRTRFRALLVNGVAVGSYVLAGLVLNAAAQSIVNLAGRGSSGGDDVTTEVDADLRTGSSAIVEAQATAAVDGTADTNQAAVDDIKSQESAPTRYVVMACQVRVSSDVASKGGEVDMESAAKEARRRLAGLLLTQDDSQTNMPPCLDAASGLRATPRLALPSHETNPAWRIAESKCVNPKKLHLLAFFPGSRAGDLGIVCPHFALTTSVALDYSIVRSKNALRPGALGKNVLGLEHPKSVTPELPGLMYLLWSAMVRIWASPALS